MMKLVIVLSVLLVQAFAMTTKQHGHHGHHGTGPTHEPIENEKFFFKYDPHSQMLMAVVGHKCYLYSVTSDEMTAVHTSHGLHTMEMKMITAIDDTTMTYTTMTHDDLMAASKVLSHACHGPKQIVMKIN